ncbi:MAG: mechanosensitive ion channel family protein [Oscillospiraceae bacterium]|nr:mechanosensitive ion channel family protein [Oscillospiraceae bacterium]
MEELKKKLEAVVVGNLNLYNILSALLLFVILVICKRFLLKLFKKVMLKVKLDPSIKSFINASLNTVMWVAIVLVTADRLGVPITSLVAVVSVVGVALSLSLQSILENIFAGITLLGTKPIQVGEYVEIGDVAGTVKKVTLFYSVIVTSDKRTAYVPNSAVTSSVVINHSDQPLRRVEFTLNADYGNEPDAVLAALIKAAKSVETVTAEKEPVAFVNKYDNSSIEYRLYVFTDANKYLDTKYAVMRQVFYAFREDGIQMTYDHLNLHIVENSADKEMKTDA